MQAKSQTHTTYNTDGRSMTAKDTRKDVREKKVDS